VAGDQEAGAALDAEEDTFDMNPYYNPELLDLDLISFDEPNLSYEYNTLCFWATKDGQIYTAQDAGCSCPTPFEDAHDRPTRDEVIATLERVGSVEQAESTFDAWNRGYGDSDHLGADERCRLTRWAQERLKT
jgi:hypothetical protein